MMHKEWRIHSFESEAIYGFLRSRLLSIDKDWSDEKQLVQSHPTMIDVTRTIHSFVFRSLSALAITETELKLIAAAAIIGFKSRPNAGKSTPAASGTPTTL
jgi:hypothetical protein